MPFPMPFPQMKLLLLVTLLTSTLGIGITHPKQSRAMPLGSRLSIAADVSKTTRKEAAGTAFFNKQDTAEAEASINFQGTSFVLGYQAENPNTILNEYIPVGQDLDRWTQLIAVRHSLNETDKEDLTQRFLGLLLQQNPDMPYQVYRSTETGDVGLDFVIVRSPEGAEFNIFIHTDHPTENGLLVYQYAERAYGENIDPFLRGLQSRREALVDAVLSYDFPDLVE